MPHPPPEQNRTSTTLVPESPDDDGFLRALYATAREEELAMTGWTSEQREAFLNSQFDAQKRGYRTAFPKASFLTIWKDHVRAGRIIVDRCSDEMRIVDMALLPEFRNQGIGTRLIRELQDEAVRSKSPLRLRVHPASRAVKLYERLGFQKLDDDHFHRHYEWRSNAA